MSNNGMEADTMYGYTNPTIRSTEDGKRVGPKMHKAVTLVARRQFSSKNDLATTVGPNGSSQYGNNIVNRCISKGLLKIDPRQAHSNPHGKGAVVLTAKGARYLNDTEDMDLDPSEYISQDVWTMTLKREAEQEAGQ